MSQTLESRLRTGRAITEAAGRTALRYFRGAGLVIENKSPGDLVTEADFAIERSARETISAEFPEDRFIGEEFGGTASAEGYTWLIDPVDGTVNFARGIGYFCISLALLRAGQPIAAWIFDPALDELFWAGPDGRACVGDLPIRCGEQADLAETVVGLGFSSRHDGQLAATVIGSLVTAGPEFRRLGAGALCLAHVAAGRLDAYAEPHMNPWDAIGGLYIARCAGAVTLDYLGAGGLEHGAPVLAATPAIADRLLGLLPAPFSGTPLHRENEPRSAGEAAT